jgi:hypothetical protein
MKPARNWSDVRVGLWAAVECELCRGDEFATEVLRLREELAAVAAELTNLTNHYNNSRDELADTKAALARVWALHDPTNERFCPQCGWDTEPVGLPHPDLCPTLAAINRGGEHRTCFGSGEAAPVCPANLYAPGEELP